MSAADGPAAGTHPEPPAVAARLFARVAALLARLGAEDPDLAALAAPLAGHAFALEGLLPAGRRLVAGWRDGGLGLLPPDTPADLTLAGPPGAFLDLLLRGSSRRLVLSGRVDLARDLAVYLRAVAGARREILAALVGDLPLGLAERTQAGLRAWLRRAVEEGRGPAALLAPRAAWNELGRELAAIRERAEALARDPRLRP